MVLPIIMSPIRLSYLLTICLLIFSKLIDAQEKNRNIKNITITNSNYLSPRIYSFNENGVLTLCKTECDDTLFKNCHTIYKFNNLGQIEIYNLISTKYLYYYNSNNQIDKAICINYNSNLVPEVDTSFVEKYFYENNKLDKCIIIDYSRVNKINRYDTLIIIKYEYSKNYVMRNETYKNKKQIKYKYNTIYNNLGQLKKVMQEDTLGNLVYTYKIDKHFKNRARIKFYNKKGELFLTKNDFINIPFSFYDQVPSPESLLNHINSPVIIKEAKIKYEYY